MPETSLTTTLRDCLVKARSLLGETRGLITREFQKDFSYQRKADQSWVTEIDLAVELLLRERLRDQFPGFGVVGEEYGDQNTLQEFTWVIDPIDGTSSLRHRIPLFGTILALLHEGRPALGLIDLPILGRLYSGGSGLGAWCNQTQLRIMDVSDESEITSVEIISLGGRGQHVAAGVPHIFDELMRLHGGARTYGDVFAHGMVLEGAIGAMVDFGLRVWDVSATDILVKEAGGKFFCWRARGDSITEKRYDVIFGKPSVVDWITRTLRLT
jgi:myo-inositol-1(or 4)-monophosphatase